MEKEKKSSRVELEELLSADSRVAGAQRVPKAKENSLCDFKSKTEADRYEVVQHYDKLRGQTILSGQVPLEEARCDQEETNQSESQG